MAIGWTPAVPGIPQECAWSEVAVVAELVASASSKKGKASKGSLTTSWNCRFPLPVDACAGGRFGGDGLEALQAVAATLREEQYLPIVFDFDRPQDRSSTETIKTLAGLSRFMVADLSGPSVPQELYATISHFKIPFVPILEAGRKQFAMAADLLEYPWIVRPPVVFGSTDELVSLVSSK